MSEKFGTWIPCSERLPEKDRLYIVTARAWDEEYTNTCVLCLGYDLEDGAWDENGWWDVIAWMPLPEPFQE